MTLQRGRRTARVDGQRVAFSPYRAFACDGGAEDRRLLRLLAEHLGAQPGLALSEGPLLGPLLEQAPELTRSVRCVVAVDPEPGDDAHGLQRVAPEALPDDVRRVFLCHTRAVALQDARARLPRELEVLDASLLTGEPERLPARAWIPAPPNIYPVELPGIRFEPDLDLIVVDVPGRNLALMPNGLAYLHNALQQTPVSFQTFDVDIIAYHRFHMTRLLDLGGPVRLANGRALPEDPWAPQHYDLWTEKRLHRDQEHLPTPMVEYFADLVDEVVAALVAASPKVLGLSMHGCNTPFARRVIAGVKAERPETVILVGGFACYNPDIGRRDLPETDYMCIGEADLTVGPLVEALARGERPRDLPGVLSRYDTPDHRYVPGPMPHNLDAIEPPRYEWCDFQLYRNHDGRQLTPIIASRGCRWSRCTFCAERFYWRIRSAENFVDELEWLADQGCTLFMFNESDLNGMPEKLLEICDEIIRRGLNERVQLTGQLRIHKKNDRAFFDKLHAAGFVGLRFGVDGFSNHALRLQKKGYTEERVAQNLKDCWEAGIGTEVNWVIGVPGETEQDIDDGIRLLLENREYVDGLANLNPLILANGSVYWLDPESHGIEFREPKEVLYAEHPRAIPADRWYSTEPYIDARVRKARFERVVLTLHEAGFPIGSFAKQVIDDMATGRDRVRAGKTEGPPGTPWPEAVSPEQAAGAAATPRLIRRLEGHDLWVSEGTFFAVPRGLDLEPGQDPGSAPGVISAESEAALLEQVGAAHRFADSRGHYVAEGSADAEVAAVPQDARVFALHGEWFAASATAIERAFRFRLPLNELARSARGALAALRGESGGEALRNTRLGVLTRLLPGSVRAEARRLYRARKLQLQLAGKSVSRGTDGDVVRRLAQQAWGEYLVAPLRRSLRNAWSPSEGLSLLAVRPAAGAPQLLAWLEGYGVLEYMGRHFGFRRGHVFDPDDLGADDAVFVGDTVKAVYDWIRERTGGRRAEARTGTTRGLGPASDTSRVPVELSRLNGYRVVAYEGWVYGLPPALADADLTLVDVMEAAGVLRDVSRAVVEHEIQQLEDAARRP